MAIGYHAITDGDYASPPRRGESITPSDTVELNYITRSVRANAAGVIKVTWADGAIQTCNFLAGETRQMGVRLIWATGTTATGIEANF